ncbi:hypothetical protein RJ640_014339 [Escallonia rubra]|uniref:GAG-pre-integrase domain-containing protein n=1 Tax=Escallonia rubra TaxID=112253 RepID=A0AA88R3T8_9ASTE|nr:hypothetical protein RJ640_014339 [Escallonia rubra]
MVIFERLGDFKQRERPRSPRHERAKDGGDGRSKSGSPKAIDDEQSGDKVRRRHHKEEKKHEGSRKHGNSRDHKASVGPRRECFYCACPHYGKDCPHKGKMIAFLEKHKSRKGDSSRSDGKARIGALQMASPISTNAAAWFLSKSSFNLGSTRSSIQHSSLHSIFIFSVLTNLYIVGEPNKTAGALDSHMALEPRRTPVCSLDSNYLGRSAHNPEGKHTRARVNKYIFHFFHKAHARYSFGKELPMILTMIRWSCSSCRAQISIIIHGYPPFDPEAQDALPFRNVPRARSGQYMDDVSANQDVKCLSAISETSWLWHRRLGHMHMEHLKDISSKELVRGLPKIKFEKDKMNI